MPTNRGQVSMGYYVCKESYSGLHTVASPAARHLWVSIPSCPAVLANEGGRTRGTPAVLGVPVWPSVASFRFHYMGDAACN
ncbi:hypothetical protein GE21DRAFT_1216424 [Neurospora crassa]|nr:hypothetical protein GE21DRAFT_1216424 [Neurospora crassa]